MYTTWKYKNKYIRNEFQVLEMEKCLIAENHGLNTWVECEDRRILKQAFQHEDIAITNHF
jgi:hypothetical protein